MIRYLKAEEIDAKKWDNCIHEAYNSLIYAYSWYLDTVAGDWDALVLDDYQAVMPLPVKKKYGLSYALQPRYTQQLGIFSRDPLSLEAQENFFNAIPPSIHYLQLQANSHSHVPNALLVRKKTNHLLDLIQTYPDLAKHFNTHTKRQIKKSLANSCQIMEHLDTREIIDLFRWQDQEKKLGMGAEGLRILENLINTATQKGALLSIGMYSPVNHLCSAGLFLLDKQRIYYVAGASDQMGLEYRGMYRIFDHLIKRESGKNAILDFEGSEIPGIARFFKGFGASESHYPLIERISPNWLKPFIRLKFASPKPTPK
ncbi:MAG: hypothetical protein EP332_15240 [Bacteroidetes bacterium]|nr:MAG: hypothetical protein EP332_15240 [Bacteroidota bacterium]